ncbi:MULTISPECIES: hypothetical protein [Streptomyces]|uniref:Uncharacterized protein n=1 Tax=Streptomyces thermoviolaceus subsp. thermoviolaceus TaxID=66860 RepID=A0ABX0YM20_STRTL|nr:MULTISPECIES: hypothetical protein [Streptomyces]WTD46280.1 hypothetical protein OG899_01390 [Streptomyces thermoviolaceus]NJP13562.1 hypothetical protein [Streptomyces thermoviolaceus subsp. thermoviolaceus]RSS03549.1 hypothetical protein EF917_13055 [Streptomyces sp. WAC00469]GGV66039.1 hypothetical protein GCM10010499_10830 [Streptomyces thermoviolaceus subsp. apingens]GHA75931.1 hypothetical protein GCM10010512_02940 [Streptomyces thermoviolaceus subsp. thermoviolaceus]
MARVGRRGARFQVSSRLTWTFSARAGVGGAHSAGPRRAQAAGAVLRPSAAAVVRALLRAALPHRRVPVAGFRGGRRAGVVRAVRGRARR